MGKQEKHEETTGDIQGAVEREYIHDIASANPGDGGDIGDVDLGDLAVLVVGLGAIGFLFSLPWRIFRTAKLAWKIQANNKSGHHHARIIFWLSMYIVFWLLAAFVAWGSCLFLTQPS
jgi:hypothetical protein